LLGRMTLRRESLIRTSDLEKGEDYLKMQGPASGELKWSLVAGDFRARTNLANPLFGNLFFPEINARGFYAEAEKSAQRYTFYLGAETLPIGPGSLFRVRAPQSVLGVSAEREVRKR